MSNIIVYDVDEKYWYFLVDGFYGRAYLQLEAYGETYVYIYFYVDDDEGHCPEGTCVEYREPEQLAAEDFIMDYFFGLDNELVWSRPGDKDGSRPWWERSSYQLDEVERKIRPFMER